MQLGQHRFIIALGQKNFRGMLQVGQADLAMQWLFWSPFIDPSGQEMANSDEILNDAETIRELSNFEGLTIFSLLDKQTNPRKLDLQLA